MSGVSITKSKLLLVEGSHEKRFFTQLLKEMGIKDIQVEEVGGQNNFQTQITLLPKSGNFNIVNQIRIIRDADDRFNEVFQSIQNALQKAGLPVPDKPLEITKKNPNIAVFLMPDNKNEGALENLCLKSVSSDPIIECVEDYFTCIKRKCEITHTPSHLNKAKVQVYLAKCPEGDIHMAIAAEKNIWDWDNPVFNEIKDFIKNI